MGEQGESRSALNFSGTFARIGSVVPALAWPASPALITFSAQRHSSQRRSATGTNGVASQGNEAQEERKDAQV